MKNITENTPKYAWPASYSRINTLFECASKWIKTYKTKPPKGKVENQHLFDIGNFVHKVLEICGKHNTSLDGFNAVWNSQEHRYPVTKTHRDQVRDLYPYVKEMYRRVLEFRDAQGASMQTEVVIAVDKEFNPVPKWQRWTRSMFVGFIDVVLHIGDDTLIIFDYKTEKFNGDTSRLERQLEFYSYFLFKLYPKVNKIVGFGAYIRDNKVQKVRKDLRENLTELNERVEGVFHEYVDKVKNLDVTKEECIPKDKCQWCNYKV